MVLEVSIALKDLGCLCFSKKYWFRSGWQTLGYLPSSCTSRHLQYRVTECDLCSDRKEFGGGKMT